MENKNSQTKYFYCYSVRMCYFIRSFNLKYNDKGINKTSNTQYYVFDKSEKLDKIIELYNKVKYLI